MLSWIGLGSSGSAGIPYEAGASIAHGGAGEYWSLNEGTKKDDGSSTSSVNKDDSCNAVTLFSFDKTNKAQAPKLPLVKQGWARLRTMKHPGVLTFVDGAESDESIVIATESAIPLDLWLKKQVTAENEGKNVSIDEVIWGFKCVLDALQFLHTKCNFVHGLLSPFSIFVCTNGDWKLGLLDLACKMDVLEEEMVFKQFEHLQPSQYRAPERREGTWSAKNFAAMDIYSLYHVFQFCLNQTGLDTPAQLEPLLKKMASAEASRRPACSAVLRCPLFASGYITVLETLTEISLKTPQESVDLMVTITNTDVMPRSACQHKVLPFVGRNMMIAANDFSNRDKRESCRSLASSSLSLLETFVQKDFIDESVVARYVCPSLIQLWALSDRAIRTFLLKTLRWTVKVIPAEVVNRGIFEPMLTAFADSNAKMREETLKSLVHIVDKLEEKFLQEKLVRCITNLQSDTEASIRTNATIFLGKIAPKLKEPVRLRVLCAAFTKSMRDNFVHCRVAGLRATTSSMSFFDNQQIATKLVPQASCMLLDSSADVRELALTLIDSAMTIMRQFHQQAKDDAIAKASKNALERTMTDKTDTSSANSWTSWAVGGITKTVEKAAGVEGSAPANVKPKAPEPSSAPAVPTRAKSIDDYAQKRVVETKAKPPPMATKITAPEGNDENWDDMDGLDIDDEEDGGTNSVDNSNHSDGKMNTANNLSRTSSRLSQVSAAGSVKDGSSTGWGDDDDINWSDDDSGAKEDPFEKMASKVVVAKNPESATSASTVGIGGLGKSKTTKLSTSTSAKSSSISSKKPPKPTITKMAVDDDDWDF